MDDNFIFFFFFEGENSASNNNLCYKNHPASDMYCILKELTSDIVNETPVKGA